MPALLHFYNKCLIGMDLFNQCSANYRCTISLKNGGGLFFSWELMQHERMPGVGHKDQKKAHSFF